MPMVTSRWFMSRPLARPRLRLFCFCYAGGNAVSYLDWQASLAPDIEVCAIQLPGRGSLFHEAPVSDMGVLLDALMPSMSERIRHAGVPCALFGHSLGALLAFEVARRLEGDDRARPSHLIVSGCEAPSARSRSRALHRLPDAELIDELKRFEGTPPEILENDELMALVLPTIRADFMLAENYTYAPAPPLSIPLTVLAGRDDDDCAEARLRPWSEMTDRDTEIVWLDGGHFFIQAQQAAVIDRVRTALRVDTPDTVPKRRSSLDA